MSTTRPSDAGGVKRRLPISMQTFREVRETGAYYVDKTEYIHRMVEGGKHYFLSRPRRFGKSLLLDTIKELFEGNRQLFEGLFIHDKWDWQARPVLRLDFGGGNFADPDLLAEDVAAQLADIEAQAGLPPDTASAPIRLQHRRLCGREPIRPGWLTALALHSEAFEGVPCPRRHTPNAPSRWPPAR